MTQVNDEERSLEHSVELELFLLYDTCRGGCRGGGEGSQGVLGSSPFFLMTSPWAATIEPIAMVSSIGTLTTGYPITPRPGKGPQPTSPFTNLFGPNLWALTDHDGASSGDFFS
jgi:hypothetical protein